MLTVIVEYSYVLAGYAEQKPDYRRRFGAGRRARHDRGSPRAQIVVCFARSSPGNGWARTLWETAATGATIRHRHTHSRRRGNIDEGFGALEEKFSVFSSIRIWRLVVAPLVDFWDWTLWFMLPMLRGRG